VVDWKDDLADAVSNKLTKGQLDGMTRKKLLWSETDVFTGWKCGACGWARPVPSFGESNDPDMDTKIAFDGHDCPKYPFKKRATREDVNQVAALIVTEATE
jgi:hypothetical protein